MPYPSLVDLLPAVVVVLDLLLVDLLPVVVVLDPSLVDLLPAAVAHFAFALW